MMDGGVPEAMYSTRTSLKTMLVAALAAFCGRTPKPSKLKLEAELSVKVVDSVNPIQRFIHVSMICSEVASVLRRVSCREYWLPLVKPGNELMSPGPEARVVQSPPVPNSDGSAVVVRFMMAMGLAPLKVALMF